MSKDRKYMLWLPVVAALFLIGGIWLGYAFARHDSRSAARHKLDMVFDIIESSYVDPVDWDSLAELAIPELLAGLDPHSAYIPADERQVANRDLESKFYGVGIQFQMVEDTLYVVEVISGGAAERAGMQAGDRIIEVDSINVAGTGKSSNDIFRLLRGPEGTDVSVRVKRSTSAQPLSFTMTRAEVPVSPVDASYLLNDSIGYLRLGKFSDNTYPEVLNSLAQLRYDGAKSFILDLRGNTGGYMNPAVLVANEFFGSGNVIVATKGRTARDHNVIFSDGSGTFTGENLVLLVDEFTASSSEILAGAVQDNDRGLVIGRRTFGKGLVQHPFELPDSSEFRLTVQRYYTPSGRCIQKDYAPGVDYERELLNRYEHGEFYTADSIKQDQSKQFTTLHGRTVYGGGGITPDIFVPNDTTGVTSYYINVVNAGLIQKYTFDYTDRNRETLSKSTDGRQLLTLLPDDDTLLQDFVAYAKKNGIAPRWYYINLSRDLLVNSLKAMIARNIHGVQGYYEVANDNDPTVSVALDALYEGQTAFPITK